MKLSQITPLLASGLLFSAQAMAQDRPISDHSNAVTIQPLNLISPNLSAEFEHKLSDKTSFSAGILVGKATRPRGVKREWSRDIKDPKVNTMGVDSSYNYYFKNFNRGWYTGAGFAVYRDVEELDGETKPPHTLLKAGPHIGYKIATEGGFTFAWDFGLGYQTELGESTSEDGSDIIYLRTGGLGKLSLGYSF